MSRQPSPSLGPVVSDRSALLQLATVKDCVNQLPVAYRPRLQALFFELADTAEKFGRVDKTFQTLRYHHQHNEFPPQIQAVHEPKFQFCKEFLESSATKDEYETYTRQLHSAWTTFRTTSMATVMSAKKAELAFLEGRLHLRAYRQRVIDIVDEVYDAQESFHKFSELDDDGNVVMQTVPEGQVPVPGPSRSRSLGVLPMDEKMTWTKRDRDVAAWDGPLLAARVIDIVRNRDVAACESMLKKLAIKKSASNVSQEAAETRQRLDAALDARVRAAVQSALASKSSSSSIPLGGRRDLGERTNSSSHRTKPEQEGETRPQKRGRAAKGQGPPAKRQRQEKASVEPHIRDYKEAEEKSASEGERKGQKIVLPASFKWDEIATYPEGITLIPFHEAVKFSLQICTGHRYRRRHRRRLHRHFQYNDIPCACGHAIAVIQTS